jgi:hypothetical protein
MLFVQYTVAHSIVPSLLTSDKRSSVEYRKEEYVQCNPSIIGNETERTRL